MWVRTLFDLLTCGAFSEEEPPPARNGAAPAAPPAMRAKRVIQPSASSLKTKPQAAASTLGNKLVALAETRIGETYVFGQLVPKNDSNWKGPWDCAEFCSWLVFQITGKLYGCNADKTDPAKADAYTGYFRDDAKSRGKIITVDDARRIAGAFLLRVPNPIGHVVVSDGKGGTIEAMGAAFGVRRGLVDGRAWDYGILVPWMTYGRPPRASPPPVLVLRRNATGVADPHVAALQALLKAAGFNAGKADGYFGPLTEAAVIAYQTAKGLYVDGEVGPETGHALGLADWGAQQSLPAYAGPAKTQAIAKPAADWPQSTRAVNSSVQYANIKGEYLALWDTMQMRPDWAGAIRSMATRIADNRVRYQSVASKFHGMPWEVVGILHAMESSCDFTSHLHNGDPLTARTVHVPKGRPPVWDPSWPWEVSAEDAIRCDGLDACTDWSLPHMLYMFERYNGMGPRHHFGQATAYLWSGSNQYVRGKYVADGHWDPDAVSKQVGAAVLLKQIEDSGAASLPRR